MLPKVFVDVEYNTETYNAVLLIISGENLHHEITHCHNERSQHLANLLFLWKRQIQNLVVWKPIQDLQEHIANFLLVSLKFLLIVILFWLFFVCFVL